MPEISRFLGIVVYMLYDDHRPPHFHAEYGEYKVTVEINSGVIQGRFPRRALYRYWSGTKSTASNFSEIGSSRSNTSL